MKTLSLTPMPGAKVATELNTRPAKNRDPGKGREIKIDHHVDWVTAINPNTHETEQAVVGALLCLGEIERGLRGNNDLHPPHTLYWELILRPTASAVLCRTFMEGDPVVPSQLRQTSRALVEDVNAPIHQGAVMSCVVGFARTPLVEGDHLVVMPYWSSIEGLELEAKRRQAAIERNTGLGLELLNGVRGLVGASPILPKGCGPVPDVPEFDPWLDEGEVEMAVERVYNDHMAPALERLLRALTQAPHMREALSAAGIDLSAEANTKIERGRTRVLLEQAPSIMRDVFRL